MQRILFAALIVLFAMPAQAQSYSITANPGLGAAFDKKVVECRKDSNCISRVNRLRQLYEDYRMICNGHGDRLAKNEARNTSGQFDRVVADDRKAWRGCKNLYQLLEESALGI